MSHEKDNELQIDECLKQTLYKLMLESSEEELDSEEEVNNLPEISSEEESSDEEDMPGNCKCNNLECSTSDNYWKAIVEMNGLNLSANVLIDN